MHKSVMDYLKMVKEKYPKYFTKCVVVEYGSKNLNGTPRELFTNGAYVGVNRDDGKDVDVVCRMHEWKNPFIANTVVTTSTMEHDKYLYQSLDRCWEILAPEGMFVGTTVNKGWGKHNIEEGEDKHYEGVDADEFKKWMLSKDPGYHELHTPGNEIFFYMIKKVAQSEAPAPPQDS